MNNVYIIGLTGNIACGKSTVLELLREHGAQVLDADRVTHELQAPGQPVYHAIVAEFGAGILSAPAGPIDRRALGAIVFADPAALRRLEQIVHPAVRAYINAWLEQVAIQSQADKVTRRQDDEATLQQDQMQVTPSPSHPVTPSQVAVID